MFGGIISNPSHHETNDISTFGNFLVVAASVGISLPPQGSRHVVILATGRNRLARGFQAVANFCCAIAQWTCGTILTIYWRHVSGRAISLRNEQKTTTPPILPDSRQRRQFDFCNIGQNTMFAKGTAYMWLPKPSTSLPVYRTMPRPPTSSAPKPDSPPPPGGRGDRGVAGGVGSTRRPRQLMDEPRPSSSMVLFQ